MMADMMGSMLRGFGLSPEKIMATAEMITGGIDRIAAALEAQREQLTAVREMQLAMAAHMGLYVAPLDASQAETAAAETAKALAPFGGALPAPDETGANERFVADVPLLTAFR